MNGGLEDQEGEESVKPRCADGPRGFYTGASRSNFSLSLKFGWGIKREGGKMDEAMAKVKEPEWRDGGSPYIRSEIDPGVLELSKPDSRGTAPQGRSPAWTNKDIEDVEICRMTGHAATACWLYFWSVMSISASHRETSAF